MALDLDVEAAERPLTTAEKFEKFDQENPAVFEHYLRLATEWRVKTGGRKCGIGALTETVRWQVAVATNDPHFKINNNFRAFFVRKLVREHPQFADMFELRRSIADTWTEAA